MTDNQIEEVLKSSGDETERRAAWEASKEIGGRVADKVRELAVLRNGAARDLGYPDYYRMSLELQEMSESWLFTLLDELDAVTAAPYQAWKSALDERLRDRFGVSDPAPWHYADPFFQSLPPDGRVTLDDVLGAASPPELAVATFGGWGIDITGVVARSDLYPRDNKSQHAFCIDIDRSGSDVRVLGNIVPGERWCEVILHEFGHAAYDSSIDPSLPYLLRRAAHIFVTESIALLCGTLVRTPVWLSKVAGLEPSAVGSLERGLADARRAQSLLFARWVLVMTHFERDLYSEPHGDLDSRWWDHVERFQLVTRPKGRSAPDWAAKIHIAAAPVYYHNYLLGEVLAAQLRAAIERECGGLIDHKEVGAWLVDRVFKHGSRLRWDSLVELATGRRLSSADFAAELV